MGNKSKVLTYAPLLAFLHQHGADLSSFGSAERGLSQAEALAFLGLLADRGLQVMGVEPWRKTELRYTCDALSVWTPSPDETSIEAAEQYVRALELQPGDVLTVQFR